MINNIQYIFILLVTLFLVIGIGLFIIKIKNVKENYTNQYQSSTNIRIPDNLNSNKKYKSYGGNDGYYSNLDNTVLGTIKVKNSKHWNNFVNKNEINKAVSENIDTDTIGNCILEFILDNPFDGVLFCKVK
jgi:hypothetical protein